MAAASIPRKIKRFTGLTGGEKQALLEAAAYLIGVRLSLRLLGFKTVRNILARSGADAKQSGAPADPDQTRRTLWAVNAANKVARTTCLPQALTVHTLLARRGLASELKIGVSRSSGSPLEAHAWVESGGKVLIGALPDLARFQAFANLNQTTLNEANRNAANLNEPTLNGKGI